MSCQWSFSLFLSLSLSLFLPSLQQILIELETALLDDQPHWYKLQSHDMSSMPLPQPSPYMPRRQTHSEKKLQSECVCVLCVCVSQKATDKEREGERERGRKGGMERGNKGEREEKRHCMPPEEKTSSRELGISTGRFHRQNTAHGLSV